MDFLKIEDLLFRLEVINKDELGEREFFQEVIKVIKDMHEAGLTKEEFNEFSNKLSEIGCVDYKTWLAEKSNVRAELRRPNLESGSKDGSLSVGARLIDSCMTDYEHSQYRLNLITEKGEKSGFLQMWLRNNKKILDGEKENPDKTFENQELVESEEREIEEYKLKKEQLTLEIEEIEQQIDTLEIEEAQLKNRKIRKQLELNDLGEK